MSNDVGMLLRLFLVVEVCRVVILRLALVGGKIWDVDVIFLFLWLGFDMCGGKSGMLLRFKESC